MPYVAIAPYIAYASLAIAAAGAAVGTVSAIQQGQAAKQSAAYNARVAENNATVERYNAEMQAQQAEFNARNVAAQMAFEQDAARRQTHEVGTVSAQNEDAARLKRDRAMAEYSNRVGGSGIQATGSSQDVWADLGAQGDKEAEAIRQNGIFQRNEISTSLTSSMNRGNLEIWQIRSAASVGAYNSQTAINRSISSSRLSMMEGKNAVTSSYYGAAGSVLSGLGSMAGTAAGMNQYPNIGATSKGGAYNPYAQVRSATPAYS
jgi:hypothetical protein